MVGRDWWRAGSCGWAGRVAGLVDWLAGSDDRLVQMAGRVGAEWIVGVKIFLEWTYLHSTYIEY